MIFLENMITNMSKQIIQLNEQLDTEKNNNHSLNERLSKLENQIQSCQKHSHDKQLQLNVNQNLQSQVSKIVNDVQVVQKNHQIMTKELLTKSEIEYLINNHIQNSLKLNQDQIFTMIKQELKDVPNSAMLESNVNRMQQALLENIKSDVSNRFESYDVHVKAQILDINENLGAMKLNSHTLFNDMLKPINQSIMDLNQQFKLNQMSTISIIKETLQNVDLQHESLKNRFEKSFHSFENHINQRIENEIKVLCRPLVVI
ncbi:hypothetical protein BC833DRAFT_572832 [Globomyces pollinis-pini]|nr:hypothetical protein BC833DRAFT_572832 [Globomyces pollinis-pini]